MGLQRRVSLKEVSEMEQRALKNIDKNFIIQIKQYAWSRSIVLLH
jgi:hypothetical protein